MFALDHHDGSCHYTEDTDGYQVDFDMQRSDKDRPDITYDEKKIGIRVNEIRKLIDEMQDPKFVEKVLGFSYKNPFRLDLEKLIVAGHSMGGCTAFKAA